TSEGGSWAASTPPRSSAAHRVQVLAHAVQVGDVAGEHEVQRGHLTERRRRVGAPHPPVRGLGIREENLKVLVNPEYVGHPLEHVPPEALHLAGLPLVERGGRRTAEQYPRLRIAQRPGLGDAEEGPKRRRGG